MAGTRRVTGTILRPDGAPWASFLIGFDTTSTVSTATATLPGTAIRGRTTTNTVTVTTEDDGTFVADLETDVPIQVTMLGALVTSGTATLYPSDAQFRIVVPEGDNPISMEDIRAGDATPVTPTLLGRIESLEGVLALLTGGTAGQVLAKLSDAPMDIGWIDRTAIYAEEGE